MSKHVPEPELLAQAATTSPSSKPSSSDAAAAAPGEEALYELWVVTEPAEATIELISGPGPYRDGMKLPSGRYQLRISHPGYVTEDRLIRILSSTHTVHVRLQRAARSSQAGRRFWTR